MGEKFKKKKAFCQLQNSTSIFFDRVDKSLMNQDHQCNIYSWTTHKINV